MKFLIPLCCLLLYPVVVLASLRAAPAQATFLYSAYLYDYLSTGQGQPTQIARDCAAQNGKTTACTLNEFLRFIAKATRNKWNNSIPSGNSLAIDIDTVQKELFAAKYACDLDLGKLYPNLPVANPPRFEDAYEPAYDRVQELRPSVQNEVLVDDLRRSIDLMGQARTADQYTKTMTQLNSWFAQNNINAQCKTQTVNGGAYFGSYDKIDMAQTLQASGNAPAVGAAMVEYDKNGYTQASDPKGQSARHMGVMQKLRGWTNQLSSPCSPPSSP